MKPGRTHVHLQVKWSTSKLNYIEKAEWVELNRNAVSHLIEVRAVLPCALPADALGADETADRQVPPSTECSGA